MRQVSATVAATWQAVEILRGDGETYRDVRPLVRVNVSVVVGDGNRQETGSDGYGGREGYERFIATDAWQGIVDNAVRQALVNLEAVPAPAGEMDVVLGPGWPGVMLHEAVGHGLEGDFNRKKTSAFAGLMGQQVAAKGVTVVDDGTMAKRRGSLSIDDEGTPTNRTVLIEDGILVGYMQDRQNARLMNMKPTGNGRRESFAHVPMPRMTNTYMLAGKHDPGEIIASVKNGIYAVYFGGGQVDITSGKYVFECTEAYKIENGKVGAPIKGAMLIGNGPTDLHRISMVGNDLAARQRHRHLRQERAGRSGRRRPADAAHRSHHRRRHGLVRGLQRTTPGNAARPVPRRRNFLLEITMCGRDAVAGPAIGPGPTAVLGLACIGAGFALGIWRRFERAIIAAVTIDGKLELAHFGLDDAGTAYARNAAAQLLRRHDLALEPAHRRAA